MIQCVESRNDEHPYCSRVCCSEAVKNALEIKRRVPQAPTWSSWRRDIRTYGFRETVLPEGPRGRRALRPPPGEAATRWSSEDERPGRCACTTPARDRDLVLRPDLLVLSTGIAPAPDNPVLSAAAADALTADGFFLEAHPKLRPVDLANEGEFLCGLAHSPRFIDETIAQAQAAAGRATTVLSKTLPGDPRPGGPGRPGSTAWPAPPASRSAPTARP